MERMGDKKKCIIYIYGDLLSHCGGWSDSAESTGSLQGQPPKVKGLRWTQPKREYQTLKMVLYEK